MLASHLQCIECGAPIRGSAGLGLCASCALRGAINIGKRADEDIGQRGVARPFGDYELLDEVARGGMGIVYRARQRSLNRVVALKVLLGGAFAGEQGKRRLLAEANTVAKLHHPNIVAIHEAGELDGQPFYAMEFIEGRTLADVIREGPLSAQRAARYVARIAAAVHYAHSQGVLHRDLKPSNVILDASDEPQVLDFGLAKIFVHEDAGRGPQSGDSSESVLTLTGQVLGSPAYMPPEQASGKRGEVGVRSDVYALGAILYHLVTGRAPFCAESVEETLTQLLNNDPVPPRVLNSGVPRDLETICLKCLEKEPQRRYRFAEELSDELGRFLRNEPIQARPTGSVEKLWQWCRRRPAIATLLATVLLLLVALAFGSTIAAFRIRRAELAATEKLREALVAEASALRVSARPGQRFDSLDALHRAAALHPPQALRYRIRNEVIASLALPDVRLVQSRPTMPTPPASVELLRFDRSLKLYARMNERRDVSICRAADDVEVSRLSFGGRAPSWIHDFSPDGRWLALTVRGELQIWDVTNRTVGFRAPIGGAGCEFSADSRLVAMVTPQKTVVVHNVADGEMVQEFRDGPAAGYARFDPSGTRLAMFNSRASLVEIRDVESGALLRSFAYARSSSDFGWGDDGHTLAATGTDGNVRVWNVQTGVQRFILEGHDSRVLRVSFSHNGQFIATSSWDNTIRLWENQSGKPVLTYPGSTYQLHFSPDDRHLAFAQIDDVFGLLEVATHPEFKAFVPDEKSSDSFSAAFSVEGRLLANTVKNRVHLWDVLTGRALGTIPEALCRTVLFTPDGQSLLTGGLKGLARWPIQLQESAEGVTLTIGERQEILPTQTLLQVVMTPDGKTLAVVNRDAGEARVFPVDAPDKAVVCAPHKYVQYVAISPDARWLATGPWYGRGVKIWDAHTGRELRELPASERTVVNFSADGRWLITAGEQYQIWETGSWKAGPTFAVSQRNVPLGYTSFSPEGRMMVIVRGGRELQLFDVTGGRAPEPLAVFATPAQARLASPRFSSDGTLLTAVGGNGEAFLWDLRLIRQQLAGFKVDWELPPFLEEASARK